MIVHIKVNSVEKTSLDIDNAVGFYKIAATVVYPYDQKIKVELMATSLDPDRLLEIIMTRADSERARIKEQKQEEKDLERSLNMLLAKM